jgi:hypothetical protein
MFERATRVGDVAADGDGEAVEAALLAADRQRVEQRLGRVFVPPVARVQDRAGDLLGQQVHRPRPRHRLGRAEMRQQRALARRAPRPAPRRAAWRRRPWRASPGARRWRSGAPRPAGAGRSRAPGRSWRSAKGGGRGGGTPPCRRRGRCPWRRRRPGCRRPPDRPDAGHRRDLPGAAVDQQKVGPGSPSRSGSSFSSRSKRRVSTSFIMPKSSPGVRSVAADVELAVLALDEPVRPGDDHRADGVGALDMAVVVDLDPARRASSPKASASPASSFAAPRPRPCAGQAFAGVAQRRSRPVRPSRPAAARAVRPCARRGRTAASWTRSSLSRWGATAGSAAAAACRRRTGRGRPPGSRLLGARAGARDRSRGCPSSGWRG